MKRALSVGVVVAMSWALVLANGIAAAEPENVTLSGHVLVGHPGTYEGLGVTEGWETAATTYRGTSPRVSTESGST